MNAIQTCWIMGALFSIVQILCLVVAMDGEVPLQWNVEEVNGHFWGYLNE